ncbi:sterile alpha motif domain containing 1a isoform X1 [Alosa alosa]|uniref:sterile alpha motif domain containing 1a isoform X1 n=1 Tax=Alosa alosa TaxID=278164 RepID=UPI0020153D5D|nr:sterile alpha motif domain containing 1a isoform X1 [Alosa alosa]
MSEPSYRDWILETIDSLRSRKARPDLERICRMVRRRHGSEPDRTCKELEKLIQEQTVLKVNYKGSISYRNAAKVQRNRKKLSQVTNRSVVKQPALPDSSNDDSVLGPTEDEMGDMEVMHGSQFHDSTLDTTVDSTDIGEDTTVSLVSETTIFTLTQGSVSMAVELNNALTQDGTGNTQDECGNTGSCSGHGDEMGICAHVSSLPHPLGPSCNGHWPSDRPSLGKCSPSLAPLKHEGYEGNAYQAEPLPTGSLRETGVLELGSQPLALCPSVQRYALKREEGMRAVESAATPDQLGSKCSHTQDEAMQVSKGHSQMCSYGSENGKESTKGMKVTVTSTLEQDAFVKDTEQSREVSEGSGEIGTDPMQWTVADVASYFTTAGFPEQALAFRTQEIDGRALLLMQRSDVLTGLSIRLGPALKIYERHVKMLQRRVFQDDGDLS